MSPGILDVLKNDVVFFDGEPLVPEGAAERALVVGTPQGDLEQDAVRLAGGPYDHSVVMHGIIFLSTQLSDISKITRGPARFESDVC
jgi:hypothetical protein